MENDVLKLTGHFDGRPNFQHGGGLGFAREFDTTSTHVRKLGEDLEGVLKFWEKNKTLGGALVSVHYIDIVAKSNRVNELLFDGNTDAEKTIRGARFARTEEHGRVHVFTHFVTLDALRRSISRLQEVAEIMDSDYKGRVDCEKVEEIRKDDLSPEAREKMSKSDFRQLVHDAYYVDSFKVDRTARKFDEDMLVSLYDVGLTPEDLLAKFDIRIDKDKVLNSTTVQLTAGQINQLVDAAPYLIAMDVVDFRKIADECEGEETDRAAEEAQSLIPKPKNEPTIGVIDTQFNEAAYFHEWVEAHNMLSDEIEIDDRDRDHGTAVASIIVDGPKGNKDLEDECGRFKVRFFGVATKDGFRAFSVLKQIRRIVSENRDIKVWNLSLGADLEIEEDFISPEAAALDQIQNEYDVLFVVAGTNIPPGSARTDMKIGAPADSLNALVVNAVTYEGAPTSYTRHGPVLAFFNKPDISYYGGECAGDQYDLMTVCRVRKGLNMGHRTAGTSYAAPWIARKAAYLIHIMGLNREETKALLIDSAAAWDVCTNMPKMGFGVVPKRISEILRCKKNEIRFVLTAKTEAYETYNFSIPVPAIEGKGHPYFARATLVYFPRCDRNQGVDYTVTELDVKLGRVYIDSKMNVKKVKSINNDTQGEAGGPGVKEENARKIYRKWDNVKRIAERLKTRMYPKPIGEDRMWGLSIVSKDRRMDGSRDALTFGVVVTLRSMDDENRIVNFEQNCIASGWRVRHLNIDHQFDLYQKAEEDVKFE